MVTHNLSNNIFILSLYGHFPDILWSVPLVSTCNFTTHRMCIIWKGRFCCFQIFLIKNTILKPGIYLYPDKKKAYLNYAFVERGYYIDNKLKALLITDPPTTNSNTWKKNEKNMARDMWLMTHDMWHMTHDRWEEKNLLRKYQLPSSYGLGVICDKWHLTWDTWHLTWDMWHMTCNIWHVDWGEHSLNILAS